MVSHTMRRTWMQCCGAHLPRVRYRHNRHPVRTFVVVDQVAEHISSTMLIYLCRRAADHYHSDQPEGGAGGAEAGAHRRCDRKSGCIMARQLHCLSALWICIWGNIARVSDIVFKNIVSTVFVAHEPQLL